MYSVRKEVFREIDIVTKIFIINSAMRLVSAFIYFANQIDLSVSMFLWQRRNFSIRTRDITSFPSELLIPAILKRNACPLTLALLSHRSFYGLSLILYLACSKKPTETSRVNQQMLIFKIARVTVRLKKV